MIAKASVFAVALTMTLSAGCANGQSPLPKRAELRPNVALLISVAGGAAPTSKQAGAIQSRLEPQLSNQGYRFVESVGRADFVLMVRFVPTEGSETDGRIASMEMKPAHGRQGRSTQADEMRAESDKLFADALIRP